MPKSKVNLVYIENDSARRVTFNKRKDGLMKKAYELTTLCDIAVCAILFSPCSHEPLVWPSQSEAQKVISRFKNMPRLEQNRGMSNQESSSRERLDKMMGKAKKLERENQQNEMSQFMYQCLDGRSWFDHLNANDANNLSGLKSQNLREIDRRLGFFPRRAS